MTVVRDEKGRFIKGVSGNPNGRGTRPMESRKASLFNLIPDTDLIFIIQKAVKDAIRGNAVARKWLFDYILGSPEQIHTIKASIKIPEGIQIKGVDYRSAIANLAPRSMDDSDPSSQSENFGDG